MLNSYLQIVVKYIVIKLFDDSTKYSIKDLMTE